jgi:hypothetical protein
MNTCLQSNNSDNKVIERVLPKCLLVQRKSELYTEIIYFRVIPGSFSLFSKAEFRRFPRNSANRAVQVGSLFEVPPSMENKGVGEGIASSLSKLGLYLGHKKSSVLLKRS